MNLNKFGTNKKFLAAVVAVGMIFTLTTAVGPAQAAKTTLVVGSVQAYPQLNPIIRTFAYEENLFSLLWAGLTQWKPDGTVGPNLARAWSSNKAADKWTFVLRTGAKFSDGTPITSQRVKEVFDYALLENTPSQEKSKIKTITKVTASGQNVIFDLSSPSAVFPSAIPNIVIIKVSEIANFNKNPSTSGPFMVKSFSPDVSLTIVPNPKYFGKKPKLTEIKFVKSADPTAAVTSLRSGDIDVMYNLPLADAAPLAKDKKLQILRAKVPSGSVDWEFDMTSAPFNNLKARQALAYATDRATMLKIAYYGFGKVTTFNTAVPQKSIWQCGTAGGLIEYPYDLKKAKALFAEAGVTKFSWWGIAGGYPEFSAMAQILQASLKEIGITMDIQNNEVGTWAAKFYPAGKTYPGLVLPNLLNFADEPAFSMGFLLSGRAESNWNNAAYDAAYKEAVGTLDLKERKAAWCKAQKLENQQIPYIIPFSIDFLHGGRADVRGVWVEGGGQPHFEGAYIR